MSARCTGSATRSSTGGRTRSRSRSTATPGWPTATSPAPPGCRSRCCAATAAPTWPDHTDTITPITCPFTGETLTAVPALNPDVAIIHAQQADRAGQRAALGHHRRAEGGRAGRRRARRHRRGDRRRARPAVRRGRAAGLGGRPPWPRCPAARTPPTPHGYSDRDNDCYQRVGRDQPGPRSTFDASGCARPCTPRRATGHERRAGRWTADEMMTVAAARALRDGDGLLRRHRAAQHGGQPGPRAPTPPTSCWSTSPARSAPSPTRCRCRSATACWPRRRRRWSACRRSSTTGCSPAGSTSASSARPRSTASPTSTPP